MTNYKTVDEFLDNLSEAHKAQVVTLRQYILQESPLLKEHIKWNAPSYLKDGDDRITFNTLNKERVIKLVFHMGATRKEDRKAPPLLNDAPLIEWVSDIRGYMTFVGLDSIIDNEAEIKRTIREWLALS